LISAQIKLKVFLDAGVPDSVGREFSNRGHTVIYHRNALPDKTPDEAVCATALANNAILVAIDGDMKQMAQRYGVTPKGHRFDGLNIIRLACNEVLAAKRLKHCISLIEHESEFCSAKVSRRLWVDVMPHQIRSHR
jgi:predicted nuclease of predicted toxin-antitoxin system